MCKHTDKDREIAIYDDVCPLCQAAEIEQLRTALEPFATVGRRIAHAVGDTKSFPPGASARYLKLEPLIVQNFVDAAKCLDGEAA
jgi:hypothetical protein